MTDIAAPRIDYTPLGNDVVAVSRVLNNFSIITDPSNVNIAAGSKPRMYYKKSTQANTFNDNTSATDGWKYVEASNAASPFSFTIDYTKLLSGSVVGGDLIQYFITCQDLAATPNVAMNAGGFTANPAGVNLAASNFPITGTINQYSISAVSFGGSINVGTTETITSLTNAGGLFAQLKGAVLTGNLTVNLTSDLTAETGTFALANCSEIGAGNYRISIVPSAASLRTISGTNATAALIRLDSADRVTLDGRFDGTGNYIRIRNLNNTTPAVLLLNDAQNNIIRNCIIESGNTTAATQNTGGAIQIGNSNIVNGSGNDNNTITYNEIRDRSDVAGNPNIGILALGATTGSLSLYNDNNVISNNNIHDFFSVSSTTQSAVYIGVGNSRYNIDSNSIYQTVARVYTTTGATTRGIYITQASSVDNYGGHNIRYNYIGGTAPKCGSNGNYWAMSSSGTIANIFNGLSLSTGMLPTTVSNNVIKNIDFTTVAPSSVVAQFLAVSTSQGIFDINNNQIGAASGNDSIKITINASSGTNANSFLAGIQAANSSASGNTITSNVIGGITVAGTMATAYVVPQWIQIQGTPAYPVIVNNNLVGSTTTASSIKINCSANPTVVSFGIRALPTSGVPITVSGNTIQNITNLSTNASSQDYGILLTNTVGPSISPVITNNVIREFASNAGPAAAALSNFGIQVSTYAGNAMNISGNAISGLRCTNTGAVLPYAVGIYIVGNTSGGSISKNKIFDFTNTSTGGAVIYGVYTQSGSDWKVSNNNISFNNGANTNGLGIFGLVDASTGGFYKAFYNSVYIGGSSVGSQNSYGYIRYSNAATSLRNNLIVTDRNSGTGFSYALANNYATPTDGWTPGSSSYNTFITPTNTNVGEWNSVAQSFAAWKSTSGGDLESFADVNANVSAANLFNNTAIADLTIKSGNVESWYVNGKGIAGAISGNIASDFTGDARGTTVGSPTDIGADEFTPNAGVLPPNALASAAPAASTTTSYSFAGRKLGEIVWGASVPTSVSWKYYSGLQGPSTIGSVINSYHDVPAVGSGSYNYDMKLYYTEAEQNQIADASLRGIKKNVTGPWYDIFGTPSSDAAGKFVTSTGLTNFSLFTLKDVLSPVPVKLVSFNGKLTAGGTVDLIWQVAEQLGIRFYEVERSTDGRNYSSIGIVTANTYNSFTYSLNDAKPALGTNFYRLRIIENDGKYNYSQVVLITLREKESFVIYPIPANDRITIQTTRKDLLNTTAIITDLQGKTIRYLSIVSQVQQFDIKSLPAGIYYLKTADGISYRILKQ